MIHVLVPARKRILFDEYFSHWGRDVAHLVRFHLYEDLPDVTAVPRGRWLFADVDELPPAAVALVLALRDRLVEQDVPILNDPRTVLQRRDLLRALHDTGRNTFRAYTMEDDLTQVRFPVFLRLASRHVGPMSLLVHDHDELQRQLARAWLRGAPADDTLIVEYLHTAGADGWFRKYSAFIVDGRVIARSLNRSREWMVKHGTTEFDIDFQREELQYVEHNPHAAEIRAIADVARTDYGRIDYGVVDGRLQTWEINLCPTIGRGARPGKTQLPEEACRMRQRTKEVFYAGFAEAWRALHVESAGPDVAVDFAPAARAAARQAMRQPERGNRLSRLRMWLQPLKPLIQPAADRVLVALHARRRSRM